MIPLGLDTNHGYSKLSVPNSDVEKKRAALEKRLGNARRWAEKARLASLRAQRTSDRRWKRAKARSHQAYAGLNQELADLEAMGTSEREYRARRRDLVAAIEAEMEGHWRGYYRAFDSCNREYAKWQRYCRDQRELLRGLEELKSGERRMYELDDSKDQVMTVLKLALVNLAMWVRDNYFPPEYAHAIWQSLAPFFRLPGRVVWNPETVGVELRAFNDRRLTCELVRVCRRVNEMSARLPGARRLVLTTGGTEHPGAGAQQRDAA